MLTGQITGADPTGAYAALAAGTAFDLGACKPIDVASIFKPGKQVAGLGKFDEIGSVAIPHLTMESMSYRFGISDNASQNATLRGDTLLYSPGATYIEEFDAATAYTLAHPAYPYNGDTVAGTRYALSISLSTGERLSHGTDYTETATVAGGTATVGITIVKPGLAAGTTARVVYASSDTPRFEQYVHALVNNPNPDPHTAPPARPAPRPAAIRGRNIEVFVGGLALTNRWSSVQSVNIDWRVTLDRDEEFGNAQAVSQDYDVPDVTGSVEIRPRDYGELYTRVRQIANVAAGEVVGPLTTKPLNVDIVLHDPEVSGDAGILKTFRIPDARFNFPGFSGRVQQKLGITMDWSSDTGAMVIYKGKAPAL